MDVGRARSWLLLRTEHDLTARGNDVELRNLRATFEPLIDQVRAAGYRGAVCAEPGWETRVPKNVFALRRVTIHNDVSQTAPLFALRLSGLDEVLRRPWRALRRRAAEATA